MECVLLLSDEWRNCYEEYIFCLLYTSEMDWLLDNVVGRVPEYEELDDNSKMLVINQGIIDVND